MSEVGVRRRADGSLSWIAPARFGGSVWRHKVVVAGESTVEVRDATSGDVEAVIPVVGQVDVGLLHASAGRLVVPIDSIETPIWRAIELKSGREVWTADVLEDLHRRFSVDMPSLRSATSTEACSGDLFVSYYSTGTFGWSVSDASILWFQPMRGDSPGRPTVYSSRVLGCSSFAGCFWALDEKSGSVLWKTAIPKELKTEYPKQGVGFQNRLAMPFEGGQLAVIDIDSGEIVRYYTGSVPLWQAAEADGRLLVATGDGTLLVFDESVWGF